MAGQAGLTTIRTANMEAYLVHARQLLPSYVSTTPPGTKETPRIRTVSLPVEIWKLIFRIATLPGEGVIDTTPIDIFDVVYHQRSKLECIATKMAIFPVSRTWQKVALEYLRS